MGCGSSAVIEVVIHKRPTDKNTFTMSDNNQQSSRENPQSNKRRLTDKPQTKTSSIKPNKITPDNSTEPSKTLKIPLPKLVNKTLKPPASNITNTSLKLPPSQPPSSASATGNPRNKTALKPGCSLLDWVKLQRSGADLAGTGGVFKQVTYEELKKHNKSQDCWMAIDGLVFNVSAYMEYHPGGEDEMMRGAGKDATELFNEVHRWVNYQTMLKSCLVGKLVQQFKLPAAVANNSITSNRNTPTTKIAKEVDNTCVSDERSVACGTVDKNKTNINGVKTLSQDEVDDGGGGVGRVDHGGGGVGRVDHGGGGGRKAVQKNVKKPRYSWCQKADVIIITIITHYPGVTNRHIVVCRKNLNVIINALIHNYVYTVDLNFEQEVLSGAYKVEVVDRKTGEVDITFYKISIGNFWPRLGTSNDNDNDWKCFNVEDLVFSSHTLAHKQRLTSDTILMTVSLSENVLLDTPISAHLYIQMSIETINICKPYTVVPKLFTDLITNNNNNDKDDNNNNNDRTLSFIIKIYPKGLLTPHLDKLSPGDQLELSTIYAGVFDWLWPKLEQKQAVILLAAGTGLTPILGVLHHFYILFNGDDLCKNNINKDGGGGRNRNNTKTRSLQLFFFNKRPSDNFIHPQLHHFSVLHRWFRVVNIYSEINNNNYNVNTSPINDDEVEKMSEVGGGTFTGRINQKIIMNSVIYEEKLYERGKKSGEDGNDDKDGGGNDDDDRTGGGNDNDDEAGGGNDGGRSKAALNRHFYCICGPILFNRAASKILDELGVEKENRHIFTE